MKYIILMCFSANLMAATSNEVLIRGKIGNSFDEKKVKVIDNLGQVYHLPRSAFPKNFTLKQGKNFSIEVPETILNNLKVTSE